MVFRLMQLDVDVHVADIGHDAMQRRVRLLGLGMVRQLGMIADRMLQSRNPKIV